MQKIIKRKEIEHHIRLLFSLICPSHHLEGDLNFRVHFCSKDRIENFDIRQFQLSIDFIAKHGEPNDVLKLLPLIHPKDPIQLYNKIAKAIATLMGKPAIGTQLKKIEKNYSKDLRKKRDYSLEKTFLASQNRMHLVSEKLSPTDAAHLLGIASFDPDGFARQKTLEKMAKLGTSNIFPYILMRLQDSDPQVKTLAQQIFKNILTNQSVSFAQLRWCDSLIKTLEPKTQRDLINYHDQLLEKDWQKAVHFFDELLHKNNLPTDKIWIGRNNQWIVNISKLNEEQCTIAGISQKRGVCHLFLNLKNLPSESRIKADYKYWLPSHRDGGLSKGQWIMFYAVTVHKDKTVCALLPLNDAFHQTDNSRDFQVWPDETHVFSLDEIRLSDEVSYISDANKWAEIKKLPIRLSYLDYMII